LRINKVYVKKIKYFLFPEDSEEEKEEYLEC
jgi:hypothetical protein